MASLTEPSDDPKNWTKILSASALERFLLRPRLWLPPKKELPRQQLPGQLG